MSSSTADGMAQVCTLTQQNTDRRWLGAIANVNGLNWDFVYPGGCKSMSLTIAKPPSWRPTALNPGRIAEIWKGASRAWEGILDEGVPDISGWSITAHGAGVYGTTFMAEYTTWNIDNPIDRAIANRGLRWRKPTFGSIGWLQQQAANASVTITDFLNNATIQAGLLWNIDTRQGNLLQIAPPPSLNNPDRILVCTVPNPRTLSAGLNTLWYNYVSSVDASTSSATNSLAVASNAASQALYGNLEQTTDITAAGLMSSSAAASNMNSILNQYIRANFMSTFNVRRGQYLTMGGTPIDLGTETAYPHVARLVLTDGSYGGEVTALPVSFVVGGYAFSQDPGTAQVTPYQSYKTDLSTLLTVDMPKLRQ